MTNQENTDLSITFFAPGCALCHQHLDATDVKSFFAVSACHPNPGCAEWRELDGLRYLCIGRAAADTIGIYGELPGVYLVHSYCEYTVATTLQRRSLFDCIRALGPVLHEAPSPPRAWPWSRSSTVYAEALHAIISDTDMDTIHQKVAMRLRVMKIVTRTRLPLELIDLILDYIPLELALTLYILSGGSRSSCLRRLRCDPIASRLERASEVLQHESRKTKQHSQKIDLSSNMEAQFVQVAGQWYLQDLYSAARQKSIDHGRVERIAFQHNHTRKPYIAVRVNEFGITHIAFDLEAGRPKWIGIDRIHGQVEFFQDQSNAERYDSVIVSFDGLKLCAVDIPQQCKHRRTRAILRSGLATCNWSLQPREPLYVRPTIIDVTKMRGVYMWMPNRPGIPGFRLSDAPGPALEEIRFGSEGTPRAIEIVSIRSMPEYYIRFLEAEHVAPINRKFDAVVEVVTVPNVVAVWQHDFAWNLIVAI